MRETLVSKPSRLTADPAVTTVAAEPANGVNPITAKPKRRRQRLRHRKASPKAVARVKAWVLKHRRTGISAVARGVKISHAQAACALTELEGQGVVGPSRFGRNGREILVDEANQPPVSAPTARSSSSRRRQVQVNHRRGRKVSVRQRVSKAAPPPAQLANLSLAAVESVPDLASMVCLFDLMASSLQKLFGPNREAEFVRQVAAILAHWWEIRELQRQR